MGIEKTKDHHPSAEVEYMRLAEAVKAKICLRRILSELQV